MNGLEPCITWRPDVHRQRPQDIACQTKGIGYMNGWTINEKGDVT